MTSTSRGARKQIPEPRKQLITPEVKLKMLYSRIANDPDLHHLRYQRKLVTGHGLIGAKVAIVVEMPEVIDERVGVAMTGEGGVALHTMLQIAELKRSSHAFVTPFLKYRTPAGRDATPMEAGVFMSYLKEELSVVGPKYLVACGRFVNSQLFPDIPFSELKGTQQWWKKILTFPTVDPLSVRHDVTSRTSMAATFRMLGDLV